MNKYLLILLLFSTAFVHASEPDMPQEQGFTVFNSQSKKNPDTKTTAPAKATAPTDKEKIAPAIFKLEKKPIPQHILAKGYGVMDGIIYPKSQQYTGKLPVPAANMHDPRTGIFLTQPPIGYVLYRSRPDSQFFDRILLDTNLNDTLSDEKPITITDISSPTPVTLNFMGKPVSFNLRLVAKGLKLYPRFWREGKIKLNDTDYNAAIFKSTYGTDYNYGVVLLIDFDKDGKYSNSKYEILTEAFLLQKKLGIKGKFYSTAIRPDGSELTLGRIKDDYGQITFVLPESADKLTDSYKFSFLPHGGSGRDILKLALKDLPVTLPAGRYGIIEGLVYNSKFETLLKFACPEFNILKDKRLKLKLNSARMDALARQDGSKIIAAQKTYGPKNIYFNLVGPADPKDPGPELLIFNADNPNEIYFKDHLEYG